MSLIKKTRTSTARSAVSAEAAKHRLGYPENAGPSQLLNSGGVYRLSPTQQVDFHVAFGLNRNAPSYIVGVGYSFRFDGLLASKAK